MFNIVLEKHILNTYNMKKREPRARKCMPIAYDKLDAYSTKAIKSNDRYEKQFALMIAVGIRTALRFSDLCELEIDQLRQIDGKWFLVGTAKKTKTKYQLVIADWLADELIANKNSNGNMIHNYGKVFSATWFNRRFQKQFESEHIEAIKQGLTIGAHTLRKASALQLLQSSQYNFNAIVNWLGHRNWDVTQKYLMLEQRELNLLAYAAFK